MASRNDPYQFFVKSLQELIDKYEGQYVAIVGKSVVAHGKDAKRAYDSARRTHPAEKVLIGQVPLREAITLCRITA